MSNPTNNFSFDLDPYDRLAQMLDGGLFKLLPLPPSWAKYVGAQYAQDPSLLSAPAPAIPGFRKLPDLVGAQAPIDSGTQGFDPLPAASPPNEPLLPFPSELPGLNKAIARINAPTPGFHLTPGLGGFTQNAPGPAPSLPPLPPPLLTPSGGGFSARGSALPPTMSVPRLQPTSFDMPGLPPNTGLPDASGLVQTGYPSMSPPVAGPQAALPAGDSSLILAQSNSTPMSGPGAMSRPIDAPSAPADPNDIFAKAGRQRPQMSVPTVPPQPTAPDQTPHHYEFWFPLCIGCSPSEALDAVRPDTAPGAPYAQNGTHNVMLWGNNPIRQTVDPETLTITNTTLPGHTFHPGTVKLSIVQGPGGDVGLHVVGEGTGPRPTENEILGQLIFLKSGLEAFVRLNPYWGTMP